MDNERPKSMIGWSWSCWEKQRKKKNKKQTRGWVAEGVHKTTAQGHFSYRRGASKEAGPKERERNSSRPMQRPIPTTGQAQQQQRRQRQRKEKEQMTMKGQKEVVRLLPEAIPPAEGSNILVSFVCLGRDRGLLKSLQLFARSIWTHGRTLYEH